MRGDPIGQVSSVETDKRITRLVPVSRTATGPTLLSTGVPAMWTGTARCLQSKTCLSYPGPRIAGNRSRDAIEYPTRVRRVERPAALRYWETSPVP